MSPPKSDPTAVERLVWELHRRGRGDDYRADPSGYLAAACERLGVDGERRAALENKDYARLIDLGVHPMSVMFFAHANHLPMPAYLEAIGAAPEAVAEFRRVFAAAQKARGTAAVSSVERGR
ncbi:hypothetical protein [Candidatus Poriferisocius sp.]|uniref:hypothetical protein n=1 Tax=Candidatus Poriferisocius sp. TaxID=3101276 RepID=UPI003B5996A4